ncbi:MAG: DNA polymerase III subunit delta [Verrucomicrobiae bacterium]|nr:DNA polymerase III subunit delta [Verrucomicrobiae bacterium]
MPPPRKRAAAPAKSLSVESAPLLLVCGDDDYGVKQRARQVFGAWCEAAGGMDHETVDGTADTVDQVQRVMRQVREALQTLPFFGGAKVVWLKDCTFLGEGRVSEGKAVLQAVSDFAGELQGFGWEKVRLLISAGKVDRRRSFYKTAQSVGVVELHAGLAEDRDWVHRAEAFVRGEFSRHGQSIEPAALVQLVSSVGPNLRGLASEAEKLSLYVDGRKQITAADVSAVVVPARQAEAFALAEAVADRDLPRALQNLEQELWQVKLSSDRSAIGLVGGLVSKMRLLLLVKELVRLKHLPANADYYGLKDALTRLPEGLLPEEKKFNPAVMHPFPVSKAVGQCANYSVDELRAAMEALLTANLRLVSSSLDHGLVLQEAIVRIIGEGRTAGRAGVGGRGLR